MMSFILTLLSFFQHPRRLLKEKSVVVASRVSVPKKNRFKTDHSRIKKCRFTVLGARNSIVAEHADIYRSSIMIEGNDNQIIIEGNTRIYNLQVIIKSNNGLIYIGEYTSFGGGTVVCGGDGNSITIGEKCMIAEGVEIWNSDTHVITYQGEHMNNDRPIQIHDHVWLGKDVTVLKGVTIGENAIVGMKSLVTKNINPNTINAGIPAKEIRDQVNWCK